MEQANPGQLLLQLAKQYQHLKSENKAKGPESRQNRRHEQDMETLAQRFATLCDHWISDEERRTAWRDHLYHFAPPPPVDDWPPPLVFRGTAQPGNVAEILETDSGYHIFIDGKEETREPQHIRLTDQPIAELRVSGLAFEEKFSAPPAALDQLAEWYEHPTDGAPWEWSRDLYLDGLIDPDFSLTVRGKRLFEQRRRGGRGDAVVVL